MNFDFSDDAKTMRESARKFLDANAGAAIARKSMNGTATYDADLWKAVIDLGWTAARVPEEFGGVGLTAEESCVLAEEAGRSLAPIPLTSVLAATEALLRAASKEQQDRWLPGIVTTLCALPVCALAGTSLRSWRRSAFTPTSTCFDLLGASARCLFSVPSGAMPPCSRPCA